MTKKEQADAFERLSASARRIWLAGLGAIAEAEKRGDEIFESLVESGETYEKTLKDPIEKVTGTFRESVETARTRASSALRDIEDIVDKRVATAMKSMGFASRTEVESLRKEVQKLKQAPARRAKKPASKK